MLDRILQRSTAITDRGYRKTLVILIVRRDDE